MSHTAGSLALRRYLRPATFVRVSSACDRCVDLDQLVGVAEHVDAQQGGGRNRFGEPVDDSFPCVEQMLMWAYDVDLQLADIADGEAVHLDQCSEVVWALRCLLGWRARTDEDAVAVEGNLARHEQLGT